MHAAIQFEIKSELAISRLSTSFWNVFDKTSNFRVTYLRYLLMLYSIVKASAPLLKLAGERARHEASTKGSPWYGLADYFETHHNEEIGHDEWLIADLEQLGFLRSDVLSTKAHPSVAAMVGSQYYWILHEQPLMLLGYIFVLEGYPIDVRTIEKWQESSGLPKEAFQTVRRHAIMDIGHRQEFMTLMRSFNANDVPFGEIFVSVLRTCELCSQAFSSLVEDAQ
jgi:hypothetical protein